MKAQRIVNHLAYVIDGFRLDDSITMNEMDDVQRIVEKAMCQEAYYRKK